MKKHLYRLLVSLVCLAITAYAPIVTAMTDEQRRAVEAGVFYLNTEESVCEANGQQSTASTTSTPATQTGSTLNGATQVGAFTGTQIVPQAIILHWTAGEYADANQLVNTLRSRVDDGYPNGRSVQLTIDKAGTVFQLAQTLETRPMQTMADQGWNDVSIGIEIESGSFGDDMAAHENDLMNNTVQYQAVLTTIRELMTRYNIPATADIAGKKGIIGHLEANPGVSSDPGANYMNRVRSDLASGGTPTGVSNATNSTLVGGCVCGAGSSSADFSGGNNAQIAFNYLVSKGLSQEVAAGFVGNFMLESTPNLDPAATNGNTIGIAQWLGGRKQNLFNFAAATDRDFLDLTVQLEFVWFELTGEPTTPGANGGTESAAYEAIRVATTVAQAAELVDRRYERSEQTHIPQRIAYAEQAYAAYANGGTSPVQGRCSFGIGGIDVFPLNVTKSQIEAGASNGQGTLIWCYTRDTNCHHDYNAADIHAPPGTQVVASRPGEVVYTRDVTGGSGSAVVILGADGGFTYYYTHMAYGSLAVQEGDTVTAGQVLGTVGEAAQAMGTAPHLHFDMLPQAEYNHRPNCSGSACTSYPFVDVQPLLKQLYDVQVPN